ncbi:MAG: DinB family protein [Phycisphaerales bacterium JB039]
MNLPPMIARMRRFPPALRALLDGLAPDDARQRGPAGQWSILEVVCHLADEEEADFAVRVRLTLEDPSQDWPKIDPEGWAKQRNYNDRDLGGELARFAAQREANIRWLQSLDNPDWSRAKAHPRGALSAADLMTSWCAHDALHLRQIAKRLYELAARDGDNASPAYAGDW